MPARRALRTAVPLLLISRTGGGTGTTFTSGLMRLSQTVVAEQSIPLFGYMWWPNDSGARGGLLYTPAVVAFRVSELICPRRS